MTTAIYTTEHYELRVEPAQFESAFKGQPAYRLYNRGTGVAEAEGLDCAQALRAIITFERDLSETLADPEASLERMRAQQANSHPLAALFGGPGPDDIIN